MNRSIISAITASVFAIAAPAVSTAAESPVCLPDNITASQPDQYRCQRPKPSERLFHSDAVEREIARVKALLTNPKLAWMFENCFPNTIDTTVHFRTDPSDGHNDTFVYTGDIHAMWLRDSGAQVWPYVQLCSDDSKLKDMVEGVIRRQFKLICIDPYANAFNDGPTGGEWMTDLTDMIPDVHERKWEIDSLCYPVRLAYEYWKVTGDDSIFDSVWLTTIERILTTFAEQQRRDGNGPYKFERRTNRALDTLNNNGWGAPVKPCGLIVSCFRPSDDATTFQYLVPSNFFAVSILRKAATILHEVNHREDLCERCTAMANEVDQALQREAIYNHPVYGLMYAFEVDGFGNYHLMDDSNAPSLLSLPYLSDVDANDPVYLNTRRFVWSKHNPYFFAGQAGEGIGGPHVGYDMVWPMSVMMKAFTSTDDAEIAQCIKSVIDTEAGTGFIHESYHKDDPSVFTRPWFAWQNTLFGELILKLVNEGKVDLLNSIS